ncbi:MAG TPA: DNA-processing protein DprA [Balneolaceae bacterium]|nr:DNA-processing protein DprA [Balneolaceae bacterium]
MNHQKKQPETPVREFVALHIIDDLGAKRIRLLLQHVEHPQLIFRLERHELESIHGIGPKTSNDIVSFNKWEEVDRILEQTEQIGAEIMTFWDDDYPNLLREIYDPPLLMWIKGDRKVLSYDSIAIVGTRKAGKYGKRMAKLFAERLVEHGLAVISGLAYGIDGAAHKATVEAGGKTVAVLGSGIDWIYPSDHIGLAGKIVDSGGAVISEFPLGTAPEMGNFPVRNRIVSGMSLGTLVVESGLEGGSMITATSALDQNREVFVIPHRLGHPNSAGCNSLIKRGMGKLVQNVDDILNEISIHMKATEDRPLVKKEKNWKSEDLDELSSRICELLEEEVSLHIDSLSERMNMPSHQLLSKLLELEMQNCIKQTAGKKFELL